MNTLSKVIQRAYVTEFYSQNAMFFLLMLGLAFGFMRGNEHMALAQFITAAPICTLIPISIWTFYAFKIVTFNTRTSHLSEMRFVFDLALLPAKERIPPLLLTALNQFMPAVAYGAFVMLIGVRNQAWPSVIILGVALAFFTLLITALLHQGILHPQYEMKISFLKTWLDERSEKSHVRIFMEWLIRTHPGMVLFTKLASGALLIGVCQLYKYDTYDYRLLAMATLMSFCSMLAFVYQYVIFENGRFAILRNLPIPLTLRALQFMGCMVVLMIPEIILLAWLYPDQLSSLPAIAMIIFGLSLLFAGYSFLLRKNIAFESFTTVMFFGGISLFLLILFKVPLLALSAAGALFGAVTYRKHFYGFEVVVEKPA